MRKLIVAEHISLDSIIQAPGGPDEDPSGGFRLGGWIVPYADDATGQAVQDLFAQPFELLLGRRTYDIWAAYWPRVRARHAIADLFNSVPKHVATHRPDTLDWQYSHGLQGTSASDLSRRTWARQALVRRKRTSVGLLPGALEQHAWRCADHPLCAQRRGAHRGSTGAFEEVE